MLSINRSTCGEKFDERDVWVVVRRNSHTLLGNVLLPLEAINGQYLPIDPAFNCPLNNIFDFRPVFIILINNGREGVKWSAGCFVGIKDGEGFYQIFSK